MLLKNGGGVKQTVTLPKAGRYEVAMRTYQRSDSQSYCAFARLYMDDVLIGTAQSPSQQLDWDYIRFETPWLEAGPHVFRMSSEVTVDLAIAIDDVQLRWLDDMPAVAALKNGNFEDADWVAGSRALFPDSNARNAIANAIQTSTVLPSTFLTGWTANGTVSLLRGRPYFRTSNFAAPLNGTGSICAFLQTGASVRQTVTEPDRDDSRGWSLCPLRRRRELRDEWSRRGERPRLFDGQFRYGLYQRQNTAHARRNERDHFIRGLVASAQENVPAGTAFAGRFRRGCDCSPGDDGQRAQQHLG